MNFKKRVNGSWTDTPHYIHKTDTDILTTLPADIYADGNNATVGISGNTVQTGTPTPDNPVEVNGVGVRTENLFDYNTVAIGKYIDANGNEASSSGTGEQILNHSVYIKVNAGTTYTFKCAKTAYETSYSNAFCWFDSSKQLISRDVLNVDTGDTVLITATAPTGTAYLIMNYRGLHGDTAMLNTGSTAKPYEPYGYKIPISSGGVTTNIYLGNTQTTRKIKKFVCDGRTQHWKKSTTYKGSFYNTEWADGNVINIGLCTHLPFTPVDTYTKGSFTISGTALNLWFPQFDETTTLEEFEAYLATQYANGTPVIVWYGLKNIVTAAVNEPLMKIGNYADTLSNATAIPTIAGANTLSVDTTLQPSEVSVNYKGWHPVQNVHERDNGQWN